MNKPDKYQGNYQIITGFSSVSGNRWEVNGIRVFAASSFYMSRVQDTARRLANRAWEEITMIESNTHISSEELKPFT